jgi:hypothetical protein
MMKDELIARIDRAETELATLRAENARLKAPVSDEEMSLFAVKVYDDRERSGWCIQRQDADRLIIARAKEQP